MIRVLIVHRHPLICDTLANVLRGIDNLEIVAYAHDWHSAQKALECHPCDVALISAELPEMDALHLTRVAVETDGHPKVIITDLVRSHTAIMSFIEDGATGYLLADESLDDLRAIIQAVYEGRFPLSPAMATELMARVYELKHKTEHWLSSEQGELQRRYAALTGRQRQVLNLVMQGMSNQQIAKSLFIEVGTVKNHVHKILQKLDVPNRQQATHVARQILNHRHLGPPSYATNGYRATSHQSGARSSQLHTPVISA